jgi:hypothetical protein
MPVVTSYRTVNPTPHAARSSSNVDRDSKELEMTKSMKTMMITAALSGLLGSAAAQTTPQFGYKTTTQSRLLQSSMQDQNDKDRERAMM